MGAAAGAAHSGSVERDLADVPPVAGDEERLRQVLVNLTLNALEAVPDHGRVRVSCHLETPDPDRADEVLALTRSNGEPDAFAIGRVVPGPRLVRYV